MTSTRGARWSAVAVVAPLTAAAFAGMTWWAATHDPRDVEPAAASVTSPSSDAIMAPAPAGLDSSDDPRVQELLDRAQAVLDRARAVRRETRQLERAAAQASPNAGTQDAGTNATSGSGSAPPSAPQAARPAPPAPQSAPAPKPAPVVVPAPAPPPPADTTTSAS